MSLTKKYIKEKVLNELHDLPWNIQQETIEKLGKINEKLTKTKLKTILVSIHDKYTENMIEAGEPVGVVAGQSLGEPATQMTLRTFHYAGVHFQLMSGGLNRIKEITDGIKNIKEPVMKVVCKKGASIDNLNKKLQSIKDIEATIIKREKNAIYTRGSNISKVLQLSGVDKKQTTTNDIREIESTFGIEAGRESIIEQLSELYKNQELNIDIRHIILIGDMMTKNGKIESLNRLGVMRNKKSLTARASFEETLTHLLNAGAFSEHESFDGVVENIVVGNPINIGTGREDIKLSFRKR